MIVVVEALNDGALLQRGVDGGFAAGFLKAETPPTDRHPIFGASRYVPPKPVAVHYHFGVHTRFWVADVDDGFFCN